MIQYVLTDIEGTTTPISFVHEVLFPYSAQHLASYVAQHAQDPKVKTCIEQTQKTIQDTESRTISAEEAVQQLLVWIKEDRKHPALKTLQGLIWRHGYEARSFTSQIYPDVRPSLELWKSRGLRLGVYSSGSVEAQLLLFKYSDAGDLTAFFSDHFDTAVGGKREPQSYEHIHHHLDLPSSNILFLSDIAEELDAAKTSGMHTVQLLRPGTKDSGRHITARSFEEIVIN